MKVKKIWANLAVGNLGQTTKFYTEIGFKPNGSPTANITSFSVGDDKFVINFFSREKLEPEMKGKLADLTHGNEIIFTLSAGSRKEADQWAKEIQQAGGNLVSKPEEFGEGYYGFVFSDPDGHKFNVFYMEGM